MTHNDGGPAFPQNDLSAYGMGPSEVGNGGMSLRDYFAGQALAGQLAQPNDGDADAIAWFSYRLADAMLKAREVQP